LLQFTRDLIELRLAHRVFRRRRYLTGKDAADLRWFTPSGTAMTADNWADPSARSIALYIDGSTDPDLQPDGAPLIDDDFLILANAWWEPLTFHIPLDLSADRWEFACDTFDPARGGAAADAVDVGPRSLVVLRSQS
jgi:glycogen operon protein